MVVGGEHHIEAAQVCGGSKAVGSIELGIAGVFLAVGAGEGGLQIHHRIVGSADVRVDVVKNIAVVIRIAYLAAADNGQMGHQIAGREDRCPTHLRDFFRFAGCGGFFRQLLHNGRFLAGQLDHIFFAGHKQTHAVFESEGGKIQHQTDGCQREQQLDDGMDAASSASAGGIAHGLTSKT